MSDPKLHVVVGLGAVGRAVIDELVARGLTVRAVGRRAVPDLPPQVEFVAADLADAEIDSSGDERRSSRLSRGIRAVRSLAGTASTAYARRDRGG